MTHSFPPRPSSELLCVDVDALGRARLNELDGALRQRWARRDRIDPDPVRPELERHGLRQTPDRMLRGAVVGEAGAARSEEHTSELQSLMRSSYAVFCLKKKKPKNTTTI